MRTTSVWIKPGIRLVCAAAVTCLLFSTSPAQAHPMGNFAICHYTRLTAEPGLLRVRYLLDLAEIPTVSEEETLDRNRDGRIDAAEKSDWLAVHAPELLANLTVTAAAKPLALKLTGSSLLLSPGAGGLETLKITLDAQGALPPLSLSSSGLPIVYREGNYSTRTGWKEIVAVGGKQIMIADSTVPATDKSHELSVYPADATVPQETEARFTIRTTAPSGSKTQPTLTAGTTGQTGASPGSATPPAATGATTPRDSFTQSITRRDLTPGFMLLALLLAFCYGAGHALSPGHGKAMVAAYLVGTRGTAKHAAILGLVVTITHTLGVFALGFLTLFASRYIVPEKLYPILSAISGVSVCAVGLWLLYQRLSGKPAEHHHHHDHDHHHDHSQAHDEHAHAYHSDHYHDADGHVHYHDAVEHSQDHDHGHENSHDHVHGPDHHDHEHHDHDHGHTHSYGLFGRPHHHHHHLPEGPVTVRGLIALGISGGIVPCPSALVVLLSAIALHRVAFGMLLITAFSLGLAAVLVALGLIVVSARNVFDRLPTSLHRNAVSSMVSGAIRRLPVASAAMITLIGIILIVRAFGPGAP